MQDVADDDKRDAGDNQHLARRARIDIDFLFERGKALPLRDFPLPYFMEFPDCRLDAFRFVPKLLDELGGFLRECRDDATYDDASDAKDGGEECQSGERVAVVFFLILFLVLQACDELDLNFP